MTSPARRRAEDLVGGWMLDNDIRIIRKRGKPLVDLVEAALVEENATGYARGLDDGYRRCINNFNLESKVTSGPIRSRREKGV